MADIKRKTMTASAPDIIRKTLFPSMRPPMKRTFREFAEQEIVLPSGGPFEGMNFDADIPPWMAGILDVFDKGEYIEYYLTGPGQDGKTLLGLNIPQMYHNFEERENIIMGVPDIDMAQGIYLEKIEPIIEASRYRDMLPLKGAGSRRGKVKVIKFNNGATLRFMGSGGGDAQRSSHTARVIILTELDKMDTAGTVSRETDPVSQIIARSNAFGSRRRVYGECTVSNETGRIWREVTKRGTDHRVYLKCPLCGEYTTPEHERFGGWQAADDVLTAQEKAYYTCAQCERHWTEADRVKALKSWALAARDQVVTSEGKVQKSKPRTNVFGFRWNCIASGLKTIPDIAEKEYTVQEAGTDEAMRDLKQFWWNEPDEEDLERVISFERDAVYRKISKYPRRTIPEQTEFVTVAIDPGKYICWWAGFAWWGRAQGGCFDYGSFAVPQNEEYLKLAIFQALQSFRHEVLEIGWKKGDKVITPDRIGIDAGYIPDAVYDFIRDSGQGRYLALKGVGTSEQDNWKPPKKAKGRQRGNNWYIQKQERPNADIKLLLTYSDYWKEEVHQGFLAPSGTPGSLVLFEGEKVEHLEFAKQMSNEKRSIVYAVGGRPKITWTRKGSRPNHLFDVSAYNRVLADTLKLTLREKTPTRERPRRVPGKKREGSYQIGR